MRLRGTVHVVRVEQLSNDFPYRGLWSRKSTFWVEPQGSGLYVN